MKKFISLFKAEHYKTKSNIAVLLFLLCPFVAITGIYIAGLIGTYTSIKAGDITEYGANPWTSLIGRNLYILFLFYPFLVSILTYALCDFEYRNRNFKRLFTLPYSICALFTSKILFLLEIVFLSSLIAYASFMAGGFVSSHVLPALAFQDYDIRLACFYFHVRLFTGLLTVSFIQYSISLIFKNFVIPIGFGCFMTLFSILTISKEWSYLNPFAAVLNSLYDFLNYQSISFSKHEYACLVFIFVFLLFSYFTFKRQKVN